MKTTKIALILIITATLAHANLIDLTPGGFSLVQPFPKVVSQFFNKFGLVPGEQMNIAGANIVDGVPQWSPFTIFNTDHFSIDSPVGTTSDVAWNLTGTGYHLSYIFLISPDEIGNLYQVGGLNWFKGSFPVQANGTLPITNIDFAGRTGVPDSGSTFPLFMGASMVLWVLFRRVPRF